MLRALDDLQGTPKALAAPFDRFQRAERVAIARDEQRVRRHALEEVQIVESERRGDQCERRQLAPGGHDAGGYPAAEGIAREAYLAVLWKSPGQRLEGGEHIVLLGLSLSMDAARSPHPPEIETKGCQPQALGDLGPPDAHAAVQIAPLEALGVADPD